MRADSEWHESFRYCAAVFAVGIAALLPMLLHSCDAQASDHWRGVRAARAWALAMPVALYGSDFVGYDKRAALIHELAPGLVRQAEVRGIDPILVATSISAESAWKPDVKGKLGEVGLMQVHGMCAVGYQLLSPAEQIRAGIDCLAAAITACEGSVEAGLVRYLTGRCTTEKASVRRRVNYRMMRWREAAVRFGGAR